MNRKTVGTFFNIMEKVAADTNLSDTPGNIFNIYESGIQINNKPDSVIAEKRSKMSTFNLFATDFFFQILAHSVFKM